MATADGSPPPNRCRTREQVRALAGGRYAGCNQHHLTDLLAERESIGISRSTVRRILQEEGITSPRTHRVATHVTTGALPEGRDVVQIDGSPQPGSAIEVRASASSVA